MNLRTGPSLYRRFPMDEQKDDSSSTLSDGSNKAPVGAVETNSHSHTAGISTHSTLMELPPPSTDAKIGSEDAPWLRLTGREIMNIRRKYKKSANWQPSSELLDRHLKEAGRGIFEYLKAKELAYTTYSDVFDENSTQTAILLADFKSTRLDASDEGVKNRGMILNEAKKRKRTRDQEEAEESWETTSSSSSPGSGILPLSKQDNDTAFLLNPQSGKREYYKEPAVNTPLENTPLENKPSEYKPSEYKPSEYKPSEYKPSEYKPLETKTVLNDLEKRKKGQGSEEGAVKDLDAHIKKMRKQRKISWRDADPVTPVTPQACLSSANVEGPLLEKPSKRKSSQHQEGDAAKSWEAIALQMNRARAGSARAIALQTPEESKASR